MPFIGNQPAEAYSSFQKQDFTTSATTSYTLDHPVANGNEIALFINFVRQEPTAAYTASGTSLTLTSATTSSDDMYCVYLGKAVQTVNPPNGSVGLSQLSATGTKDATTFLRGDNTFASAGGTMTPAFEASMSAEQNPTDDVITKVDFDTEVFDTAGAYDHSTNQRFTVPSGQAGKYFFYCYSTLGSSNSNALVDVKLFFYKNGSASGKRSLYVGGDTAIHLSLTNVFDLSVGDYIEVYAGVNISSGTVEIRQTDSSFGAYKIIE